MASSQTTNYSLPQWSKSDRIQMSDFNSAMSTIDAALKSAHDAVSKCGNCKIVTGSYVGTGVYGAKNKSVLTFTAPPLALFIAGDGNQLFSVRGAARYMSQANVTLPIEWDGNTIRWYSNLSSADQCNYENTTYHYIALFAVD